MPRFKVSLVPTGSHHRRTWGLVFFVLVLAVQVFAQKFVPEHVVFPITDFKPDLTNIAPFSIKFGTGFCLDQDCRFVGTNYHVAKIMGRYVRIKGVFAAHLYLDSGPYDTGAQEVDFVGGGSLKYTPAHDLAIYEMRHPLKGFHGAGFDTDELENNTEADIYSFPFNLNPKRGLVSWHARFIGKTRQGLLAFSYEEGQVRAGASGGIVIDSATQKIIGILNGIAKEKDRIVLAVPVKELADFVSRAQPYLQTSIFPKTVFISPVAKDLYTPYAWPRSGSFSQRPPEPLEVVKLRHTAQQLANSMRNFTATETFSWGHDNREPDLTDAYETLILEGWQRWRRLNDQKFSDDSPFPHLLLTASITTGDLWSQLPRMVGIELNLKIHAAPDAVVGGRTVHVFQYAANAEDGVCGFQTFGSSGSKKKFYDCHGEVWTDESGNILRISQTLDLSGPWYSFWGVMTYGWLMKDGKQYLVPITFATQAENKKMYWCRGLFTDYDMFGVKAQLVLPNEAGQTQKSNLDRE